VVRTYAPLGQTPVLNVPKSYEHLSVLCALTEDYRLYWHYQRRPYTGADIASFLAKLSRKLARPLLIIWDGARVHFSQAVKTWLRSLENSLVWLEKLPAYAPELNPVEQVWRYLKHVLLANLCAHNLDELANYLVQAFFKLRPKWRILAAFLKFTGFRL
jgi:transposase